MTMMARLARLFPSGGRADVQPAAHPPAFGTAAALPFALWLALGAAAGPAGAKPPPGAAAASAADAQSSADADADADADGQAIPKPEEAGIWIGTSAVVCLEQDAALKATPFGRQLVQSPAYTAWHAQQKPAVLACLAQKRLLPPALCRDIFAQDPENHDDHSRALYDKHASGIANLARLDECTTL